MKILLRVLQNNWYKNNDDNKENGLANMTTKYMILKNRKKIDAEFY